MKKIIIILFCCFLYTLNETNAQTFHGIIFANTNDHKIGNAASADLRKVKSLFDEISANLHYQPDLIIREGTDFTYSNLKQALGGLTVGDNDIIFFYIITHGAGSKSSPFPVVYLKGRGVSMAELHDTLSTLYPNAHSIISISQACNKGSVSSEPIHMILKDSIAVKRDYAPLFVHRQRIIATSSQHGMTSWCNSSGSYFTEAFSETLNSYSGADVASDWNELFEKIELAYYEVQRHHGFRPKNYRRPVFHIVNL